MLRNKFYVTTTIYYVNDVPHVGHAYTTLAGDVVARYWKERLDNENCFFLTGTDEHGQKVAESAQKKGLSPKQFADEVSPRFEEAWKLLNIDYDYFIRTTNPQHEKVVQELLQKIYDNGYIYEGTYEGLYCVGCEKFLTETDIVDGKCPLHPNAKPVHQKEKNYFLKLSELSKAVHQKIKNKEYEIKPSKRRNEILKRLEKGVDDISISREGVSWGIPIPWDTKQTIYVWVDALVNYYSATQFVKNKKKFWPADLHLVGKDILWFHTVIWQALLIAADIKLPKTVFAHGFFTIDGQKISKSIGNTISPKELVDKYGTDGARYLILSAVTFGEDGDIKLSEFDKKYNADLANGLGNLVARVSKLCERTKVSYGSKAGHFDPQVEKHLNGYRFDKALKEIWEKIANVDREISEEKPWKLTGEKLADKLARYITQIREIAFDLRPFLPQTAQKIEKQFSGAKISSEDPLFPRI